MPFLTQRRKETKGAEKRGIEIAEGFWNARSGKGNSITRRRGGGSGGWS